MSINSLYQTVILPGGRIELQDDRLPEGLPVEVVVTIKDVAARPKRRLNDVLRDYPGGQLFRTAEEVDAYLREERDSWDS